MCSKKFSPINIPPHRVRFLSKKLPPITFDTRSLFHSTTTSIMYLLFYTKKKLEITLLLSSFVSSSLTVITFSPSIVLRLFTCCPFIKLLGKLHNSSSEYFLSHKLFCCVILTLPFLSARWSPFNLCAILKSEFILHKRECTVCYALNSSPCNNLNEVVQVCCTKSWEQTPCRRMQHHVRLVHAMSTLQQNLHWQQWQRFFNRNIRTDYTIYAPKNVLSFFFEFKIKCRCIEFYFFWGHWWSPFTSLQRHILQ